MKIQVISDLHIEFKPFTLKVNPLADVLVIAGDTVALHNGYDNLYKIEDLIKNVTIPVIMIAGNHEYYKSLSINKVNSIIKELETKYSHFHFLNNETWIYKDVEFIGSTLWSNFDLSLNRNSFSNMVQTAISDFFVITGNNGGLITPREMISLNTIARDFIMNALRVSTANKKVVVTHFIPTEDGISEYYKDPKRNSLNPYFACNCDNLMVGVNTWIFGHTHSSFDFIKEIKSDSGQLLNKVHLVCNPRGYDKENKRSFKSTKVIDV